MNAFVVALTTGLLSGSVGSVALVADDEVKVVEGVPITVTVTDDESEDVATDDEETTSITVASGDADTDATASGESYSIEVHASSESTDESADGEEPKVKATAKVIVVGPDGQRKVYTLEGADAQALKLDLGDDAGAKAAIEKLQRVMVMRAAKDSGTDEVAVIAESADEERFMIGVQCDAVGESLRSHLKLGEHGLIVMEVRDDTPALEAGLQVDDIIVAIDDKELASRDDLVTSVMESEGKALALTVIRAGDKQTIFVTPKKMKVPVVMAPTAVEGFELEGMEGLEGLHGLNAEILEKLPAEVREKLEAGKGGVRFRRIHPGVIVEEGMPADGAEMNKLVERIRKQAEGQASEARQHAKEAAAHAHEAHGDAAMHVEKLHEVLMQMQKQMKEMQGQMEEMQKKMDSGKE